MNPPSNSSSYLQTAANAIYRAMAGADAAGVYVIQGWFLFFSPTSTPFWNNVTAAAFFSGLPTNATLVLELYTESNPVWSSFDSFYGHNWVWNALLV